jgi:hypothetical protein
MNWSPSHIFNDFKHAYSYLYIYNKGIKIKNSFKIDQLSDNLKTLKAIDILFAILTIIWHILIILIDN